MEEKTKVIFRKCLTKAILTVTVLLAVLLLLPGISHALTPEQTALVGLKGVLVVVEEKGPESERPRLTQGEIKNDVKLKFRKAGIRVLTKEEWIGKRGRPSFYVVINTVSSNIVPDFWSVTVRATLIKLVDLPDKSRVIKAIWEREMTEAIRKTDIPQIREAIGDQVDRFINDYLAANPKK